MESDSSALTDGVNIEVQNEPEAMFVSVLKIETDEKYEFLNMGTHENTITSSIYQRIKEEPDYETNYNKCEETDPLLLDNDKDWEGVDNFNIGTEEFDAKTGLAVYFKEYPQLHNSSHISDDSKHDTDVKNKAFSTNNCKIKFKSVSKDGIGSSSSSLTKKNSVAGLHSESFQASCDQVSNLHGNEKCNTAEHNFSCRVCYVIFFNDDDLKKHHDSVHKKTKIYLCEVCDAEFIEINDLTQHTDEIHKKVKYEEHDSSQSQIALTTQNIVPRKNIKVKNYKCENCKRSFITFGGLKVHNMAVHRTDVNHRCNQCDRTFGHLHLLNQHIEGIHKKNEDYQCKICHKRFDRLRYVPIHISGVHEKIQSHECKICGKMFSFLNGLKAHENSVHERKVKLICEKCGKTFSRSYELKNHVNITHEKMKK